MFGCLACLIVAFVLVLHLEFGVFALGAVWWVVMICAVVVLRLVDYCLLRYIAACCCFVLCGVVALLRLWFCWLVCC